ncbi:MAG TPA: hypothetical protein PKC06_16085 [Saprospiraceae bacterium]|jgi:hypothetical protein|nr:hypothetical protein [Saprospiraceae bacterium]
MNKLYFRINKGEMVEFAEIPDGQDFVLKISDFYKKDNKSNFKVNEISYITFTDKQGNSFEILPNIEKIKNEQ